MCCRSAGWSALGYWGLGFRNVTNSKHPIAKLEDFAGLKLRVIPNPVYLESFSAFKANPIPMAFGELYSALETRTVDGQENPYTVILSNKFYEVQKYVSATNHTFTENIIIVSKIFWDKLSPAEQKMMQEAYDGKPRLPEGADAAADRKGARRIAGQGHDSTMPWLRKSWSACARPSSPWSTRSPQP